MRRKTKDKTTLLSLIVISIGLVGTGFWWANDWAGLPSIDSETNSWADLPSTDSQIISPTPSPPVIATPDTLDVMPTKLLPPIPPQVEQTKTFAAVENMPSGLFSYGGSTTWAAIRQVVDPKIDEHHSQFRLRYTVPPNGKAGSSTGIRMLLEDQLAFAQSSRPLKETEYEEAQQRGFVLEEVAIALDGIAVAVHPELGISGLSIEQLKGIYSGEITNWEQVGGPDRSITPYSRALDAGGTVDFFVSNIVEADAFGKNVKFFSDTTSALRALMADRSAIYYATATQIVRQCGVVPLSIGYDLEQLVAPYQKNSEESERCPEQPYRLNKDVIRNGEYPITRSLFIVVKQNGKEDEWAGTAYANLMLSAEGQSLIEEAGFVSIR